MSYYKKCSYFGCKSRSNMKSMFHFPINDEKRLQAWLKNCGNMEIAHLSHQRLQHKLICIDHFHPNYVFSHDWRSRKNLLVKTAVPKPYKSEVTNNTESSDQNNLQLDNNEENYYLTKQDARHIFSEYVGPNKYIYVPRKPLETNTKKEPESRHQDALKKANDEPLCLSGGPSDQNDPLMIDNNEENYNVTTETENAGHIFSENVLRKPLDKSMKKKELEHRHRRTEKKPNAKPISRLADPLALRTRVKQTHKNMKKNSRNSTNIDNLDAKKCIEKSLIDQDKNDYLIPILSGSSKNQIKRVYRNKKRLSQLPDGSSKCTTKNNKEHRDKVLSCNIEDTIHKVKEEAMELECATNKVITENITDDTIEVLQTGIEYITDRVKEELQCSIVDDRDNFEEELQCSMDDVIDNVEGELQGSIEDVRDIVEGELQCSIEDVRDIVEGELQCSIEDVRDNVEGEIHGSIDARDNVKEEIQCSIEDDRNIVEGELQCSVEDTRDNVEEELQFSIEGSTDKEVVIVVQPHTTKSKNIKNTHKHSNRINENKTFKRYIANDAPIRKKNTRKNLINLVSKHRFSSANQKTLMLMQLRNNNNNHYLTKKWSSEEKKFCLDLYRKFPGAYKYLVDSGIILAPLLTVINWLNT